MRSGNASKSTPPFLAITISPSSTERAGNWDRSVSSSSGKYRFNDFSSRLWSRISSPSRNTSVRNPSHFGSKIHVPPAGNSPTRLASIGKTGGFTGRFIRSRRVGRIPAGSEVLIEAIEDLHILRGKFKIKDIGVFKDTLTICGVG